ncbi:acid-sensing ion channel 1B isoform X2 [Stegostoma tigrinum]|uniref:acid-sensing ion channel 1B isoform X2 n=1 Tax=Stegostoma tigrinum TaxID=3053191 RepID=UPI00202AF3ED|nr:acid-sensing ion channel 1B isoform X2 [Stegostoma tigrinum]
MGLSSEGDHPLNEVSRPSLEHTTLHGVRHIVCKRLSQQRRLLWFLAFLVALGLFCTWSSNRIRYLLSRPVHTKLHMIWAKNLSFPAVTICNNNMLILRRMTKSDIYLTGHWLGLLDERRSVLPKAREILKDKGWKWFEKLLDFSHFLPPRASDNVMLKLLNRLGHQIEEMVLECRFRGRLCGPHNFTTVFTRYGKCYTFNSGQTKDQPILTTMKGGTGNGLELMLDIQQDDYLPVWGETDETSFEAGIKVQIHGQNEPPFIDQLGFGVPPGFQTFVSCQEQRLIYLPPPWGDCKSTPMDSDFFDTYSITACRIDCETRYLVENCNCRMVHMPGDAPYCTPEQYRECADPALEFLVEKDSSYCTCETPCNMTRYGKELSMVKIPSKASAKYLAKKYNKSEDYIGENILVLDIFFEALNYETIEQKKAYEVAGLLGDIGGQMGLFIGASLLTILELFDYMYEVLKYKLCGMLKYGKQQKRNNNDKGVTLSLDDIKRHNPCESLRGHPAGMTYPANILPHHPPRSTFEDFTC